MCLTPYLFWGIRIEKSKSVKNVKIVKLSLLCKCTCAHIQLFCVRIKVLYVVKGKYQAYNWFTVYQISQLQFVFFPCSLGWILFVRNDYYLLLFLPCKLEQVLNKWNNLLFFLLCYIFSLGSIDWLLWFVALQILKVLQMRRNHLG